MKKQQKSMLVLAVMAVFMGTVLFLPGLISAGELEPSDPPGPTMKTLQDIYDKLDAIAADVFEIKTGCPAHWRFCDLGNGTVLDIDTGLIWLKDANCFGTKIWSEAMDAAAALEDGQCGLTDRSKPGDWDLPTKAEWEAFVAGVYPNNLYTDPDLYNAAGNGQWSQGDAFDNVQFFWYWSSTEYAPAPITAWLVDTRNGYVRRGFKDERYYVWPMRLGK